MAATLSTLTIVSDNPSYPQNKVTLTVDNDISADTTIVVPNTTFPFIVEFINCAEAVGKRYISERFFNQLSNSINGSYKTDRGKIYSTLQKGVSIYPYITIDYKIFTDKVQEERLKTVKEKEQLIPELDYVGASISNFEEISPILLLQWLDLPVTTGDGIPIKSFPLLLGYNNKQNLRINIDLVDRKILDFFVTTYFVTVTYPDGVSESKNADESYDQYVNNNEATLFEGQYSKGEKFNKSKSKSKNKSLSNILENASKITGTVLGTASLIAAAAALKQKLSAPKIEKPSIPKIPSIGFSKLLVFRKTKKSEQKPKKRKRLSGKKRNVPSVKEVPIPAVQNLKKKAGTLKSSALKKREAALAKQQQVNTQVATPPPPTPTPMPTGVSYVVTTSVSGDTISVRVTNNFGKPTITIAYSAVTFTPEGAKTAIEFELNNFGIFDSENGFYPKSGSPIPS